MNDIKTSYKTQEVDRELTRNRQKVGRDRQNQKRNTRVMDEKYDKKEKKTMKIRLKPMRNG